METHPILRIITLKVSGPETRSDVRSVWVGKESWCEDTPFGPFVKPVQTTPFIESDRDVRGSYLIPLESTSTESHCYVRDNMPRHTTNTSSCADAAPCTSLKPSRQSVLG